jgi:thiamine pyrophosphate-dependent acetolactate synthase large subunit-like protein
MLWQEWSQQGLNTMGKLVADIIVETLPSSIGLQKAEPGRPVVCMAGDGGISMLFGRTSSKLL